MLAHRPYSGVLYAPSARLCSLQGHLYWISARRRTEYFSPNNTARRPELHFQSPPSIRYCTTTRTFKPHAMRRTAAFSTLLCLAALIPLSTAQLELVPAPRRELVVVDLSHFFNYCWRKTTVRVTNDCNATATSEDGNATTPSICYKQCPDGMLPRGPVSRTSV